MPETTAKQTPRFAPAAPAADSNLAVKDPADKSPAAHYPSGFADMAAVIEADAASLLRPLRRLHQLASEIQAALKRGDMEVMSRASSLLAPALAQWASARSGVDANDAAMLRLTRETMQALHTCEQAVSQAMLPVRARYNATRQHKSRLRQIRVQKQARTKNLRPSRLLDIRQ